jgi:hypothetical protein
MPCLFLPVASAGELRFSSMPAKRIIYISRIEYIKRNSMKIDNPAYRLLSKTQLLLVNNCLQLFNFKALFFFALL